MILKNGNQDMLRERSKKLAGRIREQLEGISEGPPPRRSEGPLNAEELEWELAARQKGADLLDRPLVG
jgi:hypothetical protein